MRKEVTIVFDNCELCKIVNQQLINQNVRRIESVIPVFLNAIQGYELKITVSVDETQTK